MGKRSGPPRKDVRDGLRRMEAERKEKLMRELSEYNKKLKDGGKAK